jgi:ADP-ribosylglycohydrolase
MPGWTSLKELIRFEIIQRSEEGCDVTGFQERWEKANSRQDLMDIYEDLQKLKIRSDFPYVEPSHLAGIRALRPNKSKRWEVNLDDKLFDRIYGAWLGRIAGCMLGKAVEGWSRDMIRNYLTAAGEYPLSNYFPRIPQLPEGIDYQPHGGMARGEWQHAMADDDTNYTTLGLVIMSGSKGPNFTTADVGHYWLSNLPYHAVCTAEKQAYMNLVNELPLDQVPIYLNPYREWIGAQIRADFWGYCSPGLPEIAAEFAYRDAALSHVKNGIYGEMFCAAAISAALVTNDVYEIIEAGLNEIPATSRLAETVRDCLRWKQEFTSWEQAFDAMLQTYYGKYNWVHTNNNLAIVLIALLYGWPDFEKVICISVMQGMDTDCNGATAGSIIGAALGARSLPDKWIKPLGGKLYTSVQGYNEVDIEEMARRTMEQVAKVRANI